MGGSLIPNRFMGLLKIIVEKRKTVLIVTDGVAEINKIAGLIAGELSNWQVAIKDAKDFNGTDLLPADCCFIGCDKPNPPSFDYFQKLLRHINLSGRPCGIFTAESPEAIAYLSSIVKDSEMVLGGEPLFASGLGDISSWVRGFANSVKKKIG